jgi:hypothetical protein
VSIYSVFAEAAGGSLPAQDGRVEVCGEDPGKAAAVVAFPAHFYVLAPVEPQWVLARLPPGDLSAPLGARFLTALADRLGAGIGSNDTVLAARAHGRGAPLGLSPVRGNGHPRVQRALRYRDNVRVWETAGGAGCLTLGRGLAGRWEVAFEVEPEARGQGLGCRPLRHHPASSPWRVDCAYGHDRRCRKRKRPGPGM